MKNLKNYSDCINFDIFWTNFFILDSLVRLLINSCYNLELNSEYYGNSENISQELSQERNNYINVLTVVLEKLNELKLTAESLEKNVKIKSMNKSA